MSFDQPNHLNPYVFSDFCCLSYSMPLINYLILSKLETKIIAYNIWFLIIFT